MKKHIEDNDSKKKKKQEFGVKEVPASFLVKLFLKWVVSARITAIDAAALRQTVWVQIKL